jgi:hypothetical protein
MVNCWGLLDKEDVYGVKNEYFIAFISKELAIPQRIIAYPLVQMHYLNIILLLRMYKFV